MTTPTPDGFEDHFQKHFDNGMFVFFEKILVDAPRIYSERFQHRYIGREVKSSDVLNIHIPGVGLLIVGKFEDKEKE